MCDGASQRELTDIINYHIADAQDWKKRYFEEQERYQGIRGELMILRNFHAQPWWRRLRRVRFVDE